jgi:hypothetical protein
MEKGLLWTAFGLCVVGATCAFIVGIKSRPTTSPEERKRMRPTLTLAFLLLVFGYLLSMLKGKGFVEGNFLGKAVWIGGELALIGYWVLDRVFSTTPQKPEYRTLALLTPTIHASFVLCCVMLWFRNSLYDAFMGIQIGWLMAMLPIVVGILRGKTWERNLALPLVGATGFLFTMTGTLPLAEERARLVINQTSTQTNVLVSWGAVILLLASALPFLLLLTTIFHAPSVRIASQIRISGLFQRLCGRLFPDADSAQVGARIGQIKVSALLFLGLAYWLKVRLNTPMYLLELIFVGMVVGGLVWWLIADTKSSSAWQSLLPSLLVVVAGFMIAFQRMQGTGIGIMLMSAWLINIFALLASLSQTADEADATPYPLFQTALCVLLFGSVLFSYRFLLARFPSMGINSNVDEHYFLFVFLIALTAPMLLTQWLWRTTPNLLRTTLSGLFAVLIPLLILIVLGAKAGVWLTWGSALGVLFLAAPQETEEPNSTPRESLLLPALFAMITCTVLNQWADHIFQALELTKGERIRLLEYVVAGGIVLVFATDFGTRRLQKRRDAQEGGK